MKFQTITVFVAIDANGDWKIGPSASRAAEVYRDYVSESRPFQIVKVSANVPLPEPCEVVADSVQEQQ